MAKSKTSMKDLFLKKGEFIALGIAGAGLVILLLWGVMTGLGAENPDKISKELTTKSQSIQSMLAQNDPNAESAKPPVLPDWVNKPPAYSKISPYDFPISGPLFDPIAKPDTKRENPNVLRIGNYQADIIRAPMKAYDITYDDPPKIAVKITKTKGKFDKTELAKLGKDLRTRAKSGSAKHKTKKKAARPAAMPPGGFPPGAMPPGMVDSPDGGGMLMPGMEGTGGYGFGMDNGFDLSAQRTETAISYVPLDALDQSMAEGKYPAMTVMPLRMVVINADFPFKDQVEEVKRAMRLRSAAEALPYVRFDGFNVRRRVSYTKSNGEVAVVQPWADYDYVDKYIELIDARKIADYFEGADPNRPRDAYLPYFYRYEDALVMPLPELVTELGSYPEIKLPSITATIDKMIDAATPKVESTELLKRLNKQKPTGGNSMLFRPKTAGQTGGNAFFDSGSFMSPSYDPMKMGPGGMPGGEGGVPVMPQIDIEHILLRFIDCDVKPGFTYEYQIQVKMLNPNYGGREQEKYVANPVMARVRSLTGPWVQLQGALTIPNESFIYAYDVAKYSTDTEAEFKDQKELYRKLRASDDQAVVQAASWLEEVRTEAGNQREPIGGWVLAEMPVSRGAFIGKKTYVKLPLWSAEINQYVLREMPANSVVRGGSKQQPKGWLVDFASKSILIDFEGGKSRMKANNKTYDEEVATEMLIVRPDGKYQVRNSAVDMADPNRTKLMDEWKSWVEKVESRKLPAPGMGSDNPFERAPGAVPMP
jgi:hypothetical protein